MDIQNGKNKGGLALPHLPAAARCALVLAAAAAAGVGASYAWRVFYALDTRLPVGPFTLGCAGAAAGAAAAALLVRRCRGFAARGALCIALCGLLFVFADPPLQVPDETEYYLRTYAISEGHLDFDGQRGYPRDVAALVQSFPGAWVNAHTSVGIGKDPVTGGEKPYDTAGYALKQYGQDGAVQGIADSFAAYRAAASGQEPVEAVYEPIRFLILPFLPGALGMAAARSLGTGALGCLYGGRIGNLLAYTALCWLALRRAQRARPVLLACMLLPLSLYLGASLSYDATLLGGYYLMLALLTREEWDTAAVWQYAAACVGVNIAKPYLNLLWALGPLLVSRAQWRATLPRRGTPLRRRYAVAGLLAASVLVTLAVEWYGGAGSPFRHNYPLVIARQGGSSVDGGAQLAFVLANPLRYAAVALGTLYENDFFLGQLGLFGWKDLPIPLLDVTGPLALLAGALLSAGAQQGLGRRRTVGLGALALVYALGAMTAMYITFTPVGMVRVVGLQARYFLPSFLALLFGAAAVFRRALRPALPAAKAERLALPLFGLYGALGAVLLFQHYFLGPYYTVPV